MKKDLKISNRYIVWLVVIILVILYIAHVSSLTSDLKESQKAVTENINELQTYIALSKIDSIVLTGRIPDAFGRYNDMMQTSDSCCMDAIKRRIEVLNRFEMINKQLLSRDSLKTSQDTVRLIVNREIEDVRMKDSLLFALEKAQYQIESLKQQMKTKSFGEYLSFKNEKGTIIHYVGQVKDGKASGKGVGLFSTGSRYEGYWKNNMKHGEGSFHWPDGEQYVGSYSYDIRSGEGTYYWPSGEKYIGEWKNDRRNGQGTFYGEDGEIIAAGLWKEDKLIEKGKK
ncbi:MAG: hypothetical protein AAF620_18095 [Bacteroidota bacterium]